MVAGYVRNDEGNLLNVLGVRVCLFLLLFLLERNRLSLDDSLFKNDHELLVSILRCLNEVSVHLTIFP